MREDPVGRVGDVVAGYLHRRIAQVDGEMFARASQNDSPDRGGLSPDVAERVLRLHLAGCDGDVATVVPRLTVVIGAVTWSTEPLPLPPGPPIELTDEEASELADNEQRAARLEALDVQARVQEGWTEEDLAPLRAAARRQDFRNQLQPDMAAFYRPFTVFTLEDELREALRDTGAWGIHLTTGGVEMRAERVFEPLGLTTEQALRCAVAFLLGHEYGHLSVDVALAGEALQLHPADTAAGLELPARHHDQHDGSACRHAEAFCEACALQFLGAALAEMDDIDVTTAQQVLDAARDDVRNGLPGYRDGAGADKPDAVFTLLERVLAHAGSQQPRISALLADPGRLTAAAGDVPIHIVVTPGSAYANGQWVIAGARGVVPRDVVNAVCRDEAADAGVGSVVIVGVEPVGVGRCACVV